MKVQGGVCRLLTVMMIALSIQAFSQESLTLSGIITDSLTGKSLPFAQVCLKNGTIGTVTNDDGRFSLVIPGKYASDTLLVAYMGYETMKIPITDISGHVYRIAMFRGTLQLPEVEITWLTAEEVIRRVVKNIPGNYGRDSLVLTAYVRSQKFSGGKLAEFTEAIIENLKTGYTHYRPKDEKTRGRGSNIPNLITGRVVSDTNLVNAMGALGKHAGCLGCNFVNDFVEFYRNTILDEELFRYYTFRMEELSAPGGGKIYHIWFDQKRNTRKLLWKGELFINGADYALLQITQKPSYEAYEYFEKQKYKRTFIINNSGGWVQEMPILDWTTTYSLRNGAYYLSTVKIANWITYNHPASGKTVKYGYKNEVVVTDASRDPIKVRTFKGDKSTGVNQRWDEVAGKEDVSFWKGFNRLPVEAKLQENIGHLLDK